MVYITNDNITADGDDEWTEDSKNAVIGGISSLRTPTSRNSMARLTLKTFQRVVLVMIFQKRTRLGILQRLMIVEMMINITVRGSSAVEIILAFR